VSQGVPLRVVSAILGHSTMRVTERYAAVLPELYEAAAAAMDRAFGNQQPALRAMRGRLASGPRGQRATANCSFLVGHP